MSDIPFTAASFYQFLSEKKLMGTKCKKCGDLLMPPRPLCPKCHSFEMEWTELSGKGKLVAYTVVSYGARMMANAGYNKDNPYCSGIVELEEGPRISGQIMGVDVKNPQQIEIGTPLTIDFVQRGSWHIFDEIAKIEKSYLVFKAS